MTAAPPDLAAESPSAGFGKWVPATAIAVTVGLLAVLPSSSAPTELAPRGESIPAAAPADWPTLDPDEGAIPHPQLAVATNRPRGALRVRLGRGLSFAAGPQGLRLHAMALASPMLFDATHEPGYADDEIAEFYGIEAGARFFYLQHGSRVTSLLRVEIAASAIREITLPDTTQQVTRLLQLTSEEDSVAIAGATVLLQYEGFDLLRQWRGESIELRSPLHRPQRVVVRPPGGGPDATRARLGFAHEVADGEGEILISLPRDDNTLTMAAVADEPAPATRRDYGLNLTAGLQVIGQGKSGEQQHILAALRAGEFEVPPRAHTWIASDPPQSLTVEGVGGDAMWIGVGLSRRGRYMLWREQEAGTARVDRTPTSSLPAGLPTAGLVIPEWIRTVGRDTPLGPGPRQEHRVGPSQEWSETALGTTTWRRLTAWVDGSGKRRRVTAAEVEVPWPQGLQPHDTVDLTVRVPHPISGSGERFFLTHSGTSRPRLPAMPDGFVDGVVSRWGRTELLLRGVISRGRLLGGVLAWQKVDEPVEEGEAGAIEVTVADAADKPLPDVELFGEDGQKAATSDAGGIVRLPPSSSARHPALVSLRLPGSDFTQNSYATRGPHRVQLTPPSGQELNWTNLEALVGVELESVDIRSVYVGRQPSGETTQISPDTRATLRTGDLLEFAGKGAGAEVWGWFDQDAVTGGIGPAAALPLGPGRTAEVIVLNRSVERTIHISLPRTELRIGVGAGRQRRIRVAAPVRLSLLSIVAASQDDDKLVIDEGITADLLPDDALVVTYDDGR